MAQHRCRFCAQSLEHEIIDLGTTPLANSLIPAADAAEAEPVFPLTAYLCRGCGLVQLPEIQSPQEIFSDYLYFSSYSATWVEHARTLAQKMIERLSLNAASKVVEIASNDGYLLQFFHSAGIPVLGIEPAKNVAAAALAKGIATEIAFFGKQTAQQLAASGVKADLIVANNVLAHVPDLHDFTGGFPSLLAPEGVLSVEFPHLLKLVQEHQFDTIYHEHYSYLSVHFVKQLFEQYGLRIFDIEKLPTHGGSLRILACHENSKRQPASAAVSAVLEEEEAARLWRPEGFAELENSAKKCRDQFNLFLSHETGAGRRIAAYGAPAKGNTFLNFCGVKAGPILFTVDRNPHKQGYLLPGSRIPVLAPQELDRQQPDYVVILPWNLRKEIALQLQPLRKYGAKFVTAIPELEIF